MTPPEGLSNEQAQGLLRHYGPNEITTKPQQSSVTKFLLEFRNPLVGILLCAAMLSAFTGDWTSSVIVITVIVISAILDFVNTHKSEQAAAALKGKVSINVQVRRQGTTQTIPVHNLVPGDAVLVSPGAIIPADGTVLATEGLFVNESSITGESFPVQKKIGEQVWMGGSCVTGSGTITITATGKNTKLSQLADKLGQTNEQTEFDKSISNFSYLILKVTLLLVLFIFLAHVWFRHEVLQSFLFASALAVGLTPELLPMIISLNLAQGSLVMSKKGVIVKKLSAIQNFGSMDVLCTDKTGTLTQDKISLVKYVDVEGNQSNDALLYAYINSSFHEGFTNPLDDTIQEFTHLNASGYKKISEIPFDFARRRHSVIVETPSGEHLLITKGAPEEMFAICSIHHQSNSALTSHHKTTAHAQYELLSSQGFRVLAVAIKTISTKQGEYAKTVESDMSLVGFMAFFDPPKQSAKETLAKLEQHGIEIKIVTGDNELVTKKIAFDLALPIKGVLTGPEIQELTDHALSFKILTTTIFARVTPDQKQRVITLLKGQNRVVGYMGDGVNDALPLKSADVGISVNNAVDVAKEEADLILLHKSLNELIEGVIEGRRIFANTLKYLMVALSSNFGNMFSMAGASLALPFLPMLPAQILLNNLLYDTSNFVIPKDNVDTEELTKPKRLTVHFLKRFMVVFGLTSSLFDFLTFAVLLYIFKATETTFQAGWFLESLLTQGLVIYVIRTRKIPFVQSVPSTWLLGGSAFIILGGLGATMGPWAQYIKFTPLPASLLIGISGITIAYLCTTELVKRWFYKRHTL